MLSRWSKKEKQHLKHYFKIMYAEVDPGRDAAQGKVINAKTVPLSDSSGRQNECFNLSVILNQFNFINSFRYLFMSNWRLTRAC